MGLGGKRGTQFLHHVQGTWGIFETPAGKVHYILTKARLGADSTDPERRLTAHLVPVREVLQPEDLDFNQLLQRDLDDHRVAVNLIPYLLTSNPTGPAFFPPIVAVLLPFRAKRPSEFAPLQQEDSVVSAEGLEWRQYDAGAHARIRRLVHADGSDHTVKLAQLWWNDEHARLVVLDGQHRAMALLAIDRTVRRAWQGSSGERYRFFYEDRIQNLLSGGIDLDAIEVPVAVSWLPDMFGPDKHPHIAARKLFVDVNKEARRPSESRLILLSDSELLNIFTRRLLSKLRNDKRGELLPLYCVEYDNPDEKPTQSARWSAMTNIHILQQMSKRLVFGPSKYLTDVTQKIGGRERRAEMDAFMRSQLALGEPFGSTLIPAVLIDDGVNYQRDSIGNTDFPLGQKEALETRFADTWGQVILDALTRIAPYRAHAEALSTLKEAWMPASAVDSLAYDALFGGVGMYWTLRDSAEHYRNECATAAGNPPVKPDTVRAWELVLKKQEEFDALRASAYLKNSNSREQKSCNAAFAMFNTNACQVGVALTIGTIWTTGIAHRRGLEHLPEVANNIIDGMNAWLMASNPTATYDHRRFLNRHEVNSPLNVIASLDTPRAIEFRYFWLEVLASPESVAVLDSSIDGVALRQARDRARLHYLQYWQDQLITNLKQTNPAQSDADRKAQARESAVAGLRKSLFRWFGISSEQFDAWLGASSASVTQANNDSDSDDDPQSVDGEAETVDAEVDIDELIDNGD